MIAKTIDPEQLAREMQMNPETLESVFTTAAGVEVRTRLIHPDDGPLLAEFFHHLSPETRWRRFHTNLTYVSDELVIARAKELANVDNQTRGGAVLALVQAENGEELVGVARIGRPVDNPASPEAEAAVVVRDDYQGQGIGTKLLILLYKLAERMQVRSLIAFVQSDNNPLMEVVRHLNWPMDVETRRGETVITIWVGDRGTSGTPKS